MKSAAFVALIMIAFVNVTPAQAYLPQSPSKLSVPDIEVVDQNGKHLRFDSDILKGRIAVINTFFTNCTAICPITQETFSRLSKSLGDRLGREVVLVSISIDPENDTPQHMKHWGEKFHVGPGWTLASGTKPDIEQLLKSIGLFAPGAKRHQTAVLIGNPSTGWIRESGFASQEKLKNMIEEMGNVKRDRRGGQSSM